MGSALNTHSSFTMMQFVFCGLVGSVPSVVFAALGCHTKFHRRRDFYSRKLFLTHSLEAGKSKVRAQKGSESGESFLPGL